MARRSPDNQFEVTVSVSPPVSGSPARTRLLEWINRSWWSKPAAPPRETIKKGHLEAHYNLAMHRVCAITVAVDIHGAYIPVTLRIEGKTYDIVPEGSR